MFKGEVAEPGFGHFRKYRPKFYQTVLALASAITSLRRLAKATNKPFS
jgi:hypothetical protein